MNSTQQHMHSLALRALEKAYSPYSNFCVGVCIRSGEGNYYTGANIENASYSLTLCAEATAIAHLVHAGEQKISEVLVLSSAETPCSPCGACRQRIAEFADANTLIHLADRNSVSKTLPLGELLPESFSSALLPNG